MFGDNILLTAAARLAYWPFRLIARRPFTPPQKALILKPFFLSQVMLTTPLLAALSDAYPQARFDWAVSHWSRPAICTNPRLTEMVDTGRVGLPDGRWSDVEDLITRLQATGYDTCFIPSSSSLLTYIAWRAGIPQRVGLSAGGRGFAHTTAVGVPRRIEGRPVHRADAYLALARQAGIETAARPEFHPSDDDRAAVTRLVVDQLGWHGQTPLVVMHPGGGTNPVRSDERKRWPAERFALLGNHLVRQYDACMVVVGAAEDEPLAAAVTGMMSAVVIKLAGQLSLGELGALAEVADLYIGNDTGPTHVAAATGCPTLAIFGPSDPAVSGPYADPGQVVALWHERGRRPFAWQEGVTVEEAIQAVDGLLAAREKEAGGE